MDVFDLGVVVFLRLNNWVLFLYDVIFIFIEVFIFEVILIFQNVFILGVTFPSMLNKRNKEQCGALLRNSVIKQVSLSLSKRQFRAENAGVGHNADDF